VGGHAPESYLFLPPDGSLGGYAPESMPPPMRLLHKIIAFYLFLGGYLPE